MEDNHITFEGVDGAECERFIHEIRKRARAASRSKDNHWIIELVSTCVVGSALRWYIRLDPDVAEDWAKLQRAMIDEWPRKENRGEAVRSSIPTPAAAPEPTPALGSNTIDRMSSLSLNTAKTGYIRVNTSSLGDMFVSAKLSTLPRVTTFETCDSRSKAMIVHFTPECVHVPISFLIQNSQKYLAIAQYGQRSIGSGSIEWAALITSDDQKTIYRKDAGMVQSTVWSVCPVDNSIQALWSADGSDYRLAALLSSRSRRLAFVSNASAFRVASPAVNYVDSRLVFEEI